MNKNPAGLQLAPAALFVCLAIVFLNRCFPEQFPLVEAEVEDRVLEKTNQFPRKTLWPSGTQPSPCTPLWEQMPTLHDGNCGVVLSDKLLVLEEPHFQAESFMIIEKGDSVFILEDAGYYFFKVSIDGTIIGYVYKRLIGVSECANL